MTCPTIETLLTHLEDRSATPAPLTSHIEACADCGRRIAELTSAVTGATELATSLAEEAPASLEGRLRWRLAAPGSAMTDGTANSGATTLRTDSDTRSPVIHWLARHRLALGSAAAAALVVLSFLLAGPDRQRLRIRRARAVAQRAAWRLVRRPRSAHQLSRALRRPRLRRTARG